ncbi:cytochrome c-type biogenesis protein [Microbaculum marinisediminis]|uniref:Cytochrome c-type biogenesis protein n=1 Tax=Microbaculum marinisediminis TaxID=2931392 RepID=A0AAW5QXK7_9HYPH|nr:cytochrome c-type biogenesis protein [Microbaculum sp. A6E488]MCT8971191.1 cytochrome c-type biogenesis protein CcmH [Microbaculum sp. A6E488]
MRRLVLALAVFAALAGPAAAVQPDEILDDPKLEARARDISAGLRCLVCQNQSIDDSDAPLARDLRILVRERLQTGDSDRQVVDYIVDRYGEFVLLNPRLSAHTLILWAAPVVLLVFGAIGVFVAARRRRADPASLTDDEKRRIEALLEAQD